MVTTNVNNPDEIRMTIIETMPNINIEMLNTNLIQNINFSIIRNALSINFTVPFIILYIHGINNITEPHINKFRQISEMVQGIKFGIINVERYSNLVDFAHITTTPIRNFITHIIYNEGRPMVRYFNLELEDMKQAINSCRRQYNF